MTTDRLIWQAGTCARKALLAAAAVALSTLAHGSAVLHADITAGMQLSGAPIDGMQVLSFVVDAGSDPGTTFLGVTPAGSTNSSAVAEAGVDLTNASLNLVSLSASVDGQASGQPFGGVGAVVASAQAGAGLLFLNETADPIEVMVLLGWRWVVSAAVDDGLRESSLAGVSLLYFEDGVPNEQLVDALLGAPFNTVASDASSYLRSIVIEPFGQRSVWVIANAIGNGESALEPRATPAPRTLLLVCAGLLVISPLRWRARRSVPLKS